MDKLTLFFALCIGHALADFGLQSDFVAKHKSRHVPIPSMPGLWFHCLTCHALIHAGVVWIVTQSPILGAVEFVAHWLIDAAKCEGKTTLHQDQALHYGCKLAYALVR